MRKIFGAMTALAIAAAPTVASAQQAAAPARSAEVQPAGESVDGSELKGRRGYILPLIFVIGLVAALYLLIDEDEVVLPVSP